MSIRIGYWQTVDSYAANEWNVPRETWALLILYQIVVRIGGFKRSMYLSMGIMDWI